MCWVDGRSGRSAAEWSAAEWSGAERSGAGEAGEAGWSGVDEMVERSGAEPLGKGLCRSAPQPLTVTLG